MNGKTINDIINQSDLVNAIASMSSDATNVDTRSQIIPDERFDQGLQMRMPDSEEALTEEEQNERLMSLVMGVAGGGGGKGVKTPGEDEKAWEEEGNWKSLGKIHDRIQGSGSKSKLSGLGPPGAAICSERGLPGDGGAAEEALGNP